MTFLRRIDEEGVGPRLTLLLVGGLLFLVLAAAGLARAAASNGFDEQALSEALCDAIRSRPRPPTEAPAGNAALDIEALYRSLRSRSLSALEIVSRQEHALTARLGADKVQALCQAKARGRNRVAGGDPSPT